MDSFPRLYAIADVEVLARVGVGLREFAEELRAAGVRLVQLRDKVGAPQEVLARASVLREVFAGTGCRLVMNDRADLAALAGFGGVHVGQGDLSPRDVRRVVGEAMWVGLSTHTEEQVMVAAEPMTQVRDVVHPDFNGVDYVAIGPVYSTGTKLDAAAVVGLDGVRRARALTTRPLVAIGGITRANARNVIEAGADSVAVISGLLVAGESVEKVTRDFLEILR